MSAHNEITINGVPHTLRKSKTHLNNLEVLFHAVLANNRGVIGTDKHGLDKLNGITDDVSLWINASIGGIGELLAHAEQRELSEDCINSIGWLLAGLSELRFSLADAVVVIDDTRENLNSDHKKTA